MLSGCLDYQLSRRLFMGASSATLLGMSVKGLLAETGKDHEAKAEHVILFWNGGGMSHIDTWDPKPGRPTAGELALQLGSTQQARLTAPAFVASQANAVPDLFRRQQQRRATPLLARRALWVSVAVVTAVTLIATLLVFNRHWFL